MLVHLLIALHIAHWQIAGETLAPLELSEVLYTLHAGVPTLGFAFMALAFASVLLFGRFFCSWGCHLLALQDLGAWIIRRTTGHRPGRRLSRALLWVPAVAMLYLIVWPQVARLVAGEPPPVLQIGRDTAMASLYTTDFWRNLPGPIIAVATLLICGFCLVALLGTRAFCRYACPYGVLFAFADRIAPLRIIAGEGCRQCGKCTATCQSGVRVHEEVAAWGRVVNPACLKDLDCIEGCPEGVLRLGFTRPAWRDRPKPPTGRHPSRVQEALVALAFCATVLATRGLYDAVPFLMALGLGCAVSAGVLIARRSRLVLALMLLCVVPALAHSGYVRYHAYLGQLAFDDADDTEALYHLERVLAAGLLAPPQLHRRLGSLNLKRRDYSKAASHFAEAYLSDPDDTRTRLELASARRTLGVLAAQRQDWPIAAIELQAALELDPKSQPGRHNLAVALTHLGRESEARDVLSGAP